jgi:hypothetical protein
VLFGGMMYYNWHQLRTTGSYSMKMATFGPVGVIGGLFLLAFPTTAGKPETKQDKVLVMGVFAIGLLAGVINLYLMDPGFFGK